MAETGLFFLLYSLQSCATRLQEAPRGRSNEKRSSFQLGLEHCLDAFTHPWVTRPSSMQRVDGRVVKHAAFYLVGWKKWMRFDLGLAVPGGRGPPESKKLAEIQLESFVRTVATPG